MKVLIWVVLGAVIVLWLLYGKKKSVKSAVRRNDKPITDGTEVMIQCAHCKMHVPASESVSDPAGPPFCSEEHRRLGATPS